MRLFLTTALFCSVMAADPTAKFKEHEVAPDVLPSIPTNLAAVEVNYGSGLKVDFGNELTPTQVKNKPTVSWDSDPDSLYTLVMTDPDAPSRANPVRREFKHWVVVNIPGDELSKGHELAGYVGSGPPQGTGLHRYIFLVYKQSTNLPEGPTVPSTSTSGRPSFKVAKFADEHGLGLPIAGNLYQAQYDDYVPILHASFNQ